MQPVLERHSSRESLLNHRNEKRLLTLHARAIAMDHIQKLFRDIGDVAIACIFCNYEEQAIQGLEELVASVLKQIVENKSRPSESIQTFWTEFLDIGRRPRLTNLIDALRSEIEGYSRVFLVIDALDECLEDNQGRIIAELKSLASTVSLMVTSRPLDLIKQRFQGACHLDIMAKDGDLRKYVEARVRQGRTKREILLAQLVQENGGLQENILDKIARNARGMSVFLIPVSRLSRPCWLHLHRFLMAKLHMDSVVSQRSALGVRNALDNLPKEVNATYDEAMKRIQQQSEVDRVLANRVLSWIVHAHRPLTYQELQHALAVTPQMTDMTAITEALVDKFFLVDICAGLVIILDGTVRLVRK
jgi:hypothetical protein